MSHFTVMVIGDNPEEQLSPFNESLEMDRYVSYTKEQLIEKGRKSIKNYENGLYKEYLSDKEKYVKECSNEGHLKYIREDFPKKLKWTDEEVYADEIKWYEPEDIGEHGEVYSESNPNGRWDWYSLGGRWSGLIKLKDGAVGKSGRPGVFDNEVGIDQAKKGDISNIEEIVTFALLKDGVWYQRGEMGWWATVSDENKKWDEEFPKLINGISDDTLVSIYDCHT